MLSAGPEAGILPPRRQGVMPCHAPSLFLIIGGTGEGLEDGGSMADLSPQVFMGIRKAGERELPNEGVNCTRLP